MTICFVCRLFHQFRAGLESYTFSIATALARGGHQVHIVTEDKGKFYREDLGPNIHLHALKLSDNPFPGFWRIAKLLPLDDIRFSFRAARKIKTLVKEVGIDVVEIPDVLEQGFWIALTKPTTVFLRLHGWFSSIVRKADSQGDFFRRLTWRQKLFWWMQRNSLRQADGVCAVANDYSNFARDLWKLNGKKIAVIHNAVDTVLFQPGNADRENAVLFVGRMEKNKGIQALAQAIPIVLERFPQTKFYFAGRDTRLEKNSNMATEFILKYAPASNVVFLGELSTQELIPYFQRIAVGVFPSLYEPFGIVALESMACGCATIASKIGGFPDIIAHEQEGLLVEPGNHLDLAQGIIRFLQNDSLRANCAKNAIVKVQNQFTLEQLAVRSLKSYQEAISSAQSRKTKGAHLHA